ncbi:MAG: DUF6049 family protein [Propionibacterium sp.]|nr:DUF6049 family protein [Propionibacterium sp.]
MSQQSTARLVARTLLALLVVAGTLLGLGWGTAAPAAADTPMITIDITSMTPATSTGGGTLKITGTIRNTSSVDLRLVQVYLWRDTTGLTTTTQLDSYLASPATIPVGARAIDNEHAVWQQVTTAQQPVFAPGDGSPFTVSAPINRLGFTTPGIYPVGVQVRAQIPEGTTLTAGRARTMLALLDKTTHLTDSPVVVLSSRPSLLGTATFADDHLVGELSGRLARLLARAAQPKTTVLVDPSLVDEVQALSQPHTIEGQTLSASDLSRQEQLATAWLDDLRGVLADHRAYRLPYADPDLPLLVSAADTATRDRIAAAVQQTNPVADLPLAVLTGTLTPSELSFVGPWKPAVVIGAGTTSGIDPVSGLRVLPVVTGIASGGPGPAPVSTPVQVRQRAVAEAFLANRSGSVLLLPIASAADLRLDHSIGSALQNTPLDLGSSASALVSASQQQLPDPRAWERARDVALERYQAWGEVTDLTDQATARADLLLARSLSTRFTSGQRTAYLTQGTALVGDVLTSNAIRLTLASDFVLSSSTNQLPATITNTLDQSVTVKIAFTSENPQRIRVPDTAVIIVPSGETVTTEFRPHAVTNGSVNVSAQLETPQGRPIGSAIKITLRATSFGRVGWVIVILSGVVFMGATAMRIRQVQHERTRHASTTAPSVRFPDLPTGGQTGVPTGSPHRDADPGPGHSDGSDSR